jgi:uncharacterized GH25 family protein
MRRLTAFAIAFSVFTVQSWPAAAHDTWVETNTNLIRAGDAVYIDLKLGNHGNEHRDFRLASKINLEHCTLEVIDPAGNAYDIKDRLADVGYTPAEGYWMAKFAAVEPGLYIVSHTIDSIVNHGRPVRSIKSGKACFVASPTLDRVSRDHPGFDRILGHPLELVPVTNPVTPMGPGQALSVRLLLKGEPARDMRVSFIPRGVDLAEGFDADYERMTDENGEAEFVPTAGGQYLIVAHHRAEDETGDGYDLTQYSATLTVFVPELCPCCTE